ncbi:rRNA maturation RNase YbeY [Brevundimonas mediterranea]|uniref:Endoribonuclease YbeY n=1 Tax=Brevundimonas mediterranea TaxID=74329 RepID=A0A7W6A6V4_9CAUL|nr:rRNA maturation RNase YbeY [Brevundimonas mediterranea]MBB3872730.1 putative rRNA maturation factor [Brevundimonas mediterranea]
MIEIEVEAQAWTGALPETEAVVTKAAEAALGAVAGDVVVLLTDDEAVRELNARFRDKDRPTNVLSFPAPESAAPHLGDIVLAYGVCASEAQAQGKSLSDHLSHLIVHGVLHLLGRDHEDDAEAEEMEAEEREILAELGVADPYAAESADLGQDV